MPPDYVDADYVDEDDCPLCDGLGWLVATVLRPDDLCASACPLCEGTGLLDGNEFLS